MSKAVKKIGSRANLRLALTGTVVENRLAELHSCFDFALPNYLGTLKDFTVRFAKPIENERDEQVIDLLKRMTSCFMLRFVLASLARLDAILCIIETDESIFVFSGVRRLILV